MATFAVVNDEVFVVNHIGLVRTADLFHFHRNIEELGRQKLKIDLYGRAMQRQLADALIDSLPLHSSGVPCRWS